MAKNFNELVDSLPPARRKKVEARVKELVKETVNHDFALLEAIRKMTDVRELEDLTGWHESMAKDYDTQKDIALSFLGHYNEQDVSKYAWDNNATSREKERHLKLAKWYNTRVKELTK